MFTSSTLSKIRRLHGLIGKKRTHLRFFRIISCNDRVFAVYSASYRLRNRSRSRLEFKHSSSLCNVL